MEYYTITTDAGDQSIAQAIQSGVTTTFKNLAVGDGNGTYYEPSKTQTALRHETWRGDAVVALDPNNTKRVIVTATIPSTVGGFTIREAGIFDTAGTMMVVAKLPLSEKVDPSSGASSDLVIRLYIEVSDAGAVTVTVDPSAILATKTEVGAVSDALSAHESDTVEHMTQAQKDQLAAAVPSSRTVNSHALSADITLTKADIGLGSVDNTADANKSVSYAATAGSAPANGGTAADTTTINSALTLSTAAPTSALAAGKLWGVYDA